MNDMKKIVMIIMAVALVALPTMAQQQEWQSTSAMQTSGSNYVPRVNEVGAEYVNPLAKTTSEKYSPANPPSGPYREQAVGDCGRDPGEASEGSDQSPIGDAMLPLMLMAMLFAGVVYTRRKKALNC